MKTQNPFEGIVLFTAPKTAQAPKVPASVPALPKRKQIVQTFRDEPGYRFTLRLATKRGRSRIVVRAYETESSDPNRSRLTLRVYLGALEIFQRGQLAVESGEGGWNSETEAKEAVMRLLTSDLAVLQPAAYRSLSLMQRAFLAEYAPFLRKAAWLRHGLAPVGTHTEEPDEPVTSPVSLRADN